MDKSLKVALFTQNTITNLGTLLRASAPLTITELTGNNPDIIVEMTQEDSRFTLGSLINKPKGMKNINISLNSIRGIDKNVIMQLYYKNDLTKLFSKTGSIGLSRKEGYALNSFYYTKGAVYIYIIIEGYKPILFINMHLPIDTSDLVTFGYNHREESFLYLVNTLNDKFKNPIIIIGGDLNFRRVDGNDQLTGLLLNKNLKKNLHGLRELTFPDPKGITFTCKFTTNDKTCREQPTGEQQIGEQPTVEQPTGEQPTGEQQIGEQPTGEQQIGEQPTVEQPTGEQPTGEQQIGEQPTVEQPTGEQQIGEQPTVEQHKANIQRQQDQCGTNARPLSRCDRFLTNGSNEEITVMVHKGVYIESFKSDHNAVIASLNISALPDIQSAGKRNKKSKRSVKKKKEKRCKRRTNRRR